MENFYLIKPSGPFNQYRKNMKKIAIFSHGKICFTDYVQLCVKSVERIKKR